MSLETLPAELHFQIFQHLSSPSSSPPLTSPIHNVLSLSSTTKSVRSVFTTYRTSIFPHALASELQGSLDSNTPFLWKWILALIAINNASFRGDEPGTLNEVEAAGIIRGLEFEYPGKYLGKGDLQALKRMLAFLQEDLCPAYGGEIIVGCVWWAIERHCCVVWESSWDALGPGPEPRPMSLSEAVKEVLLFPLGEDFPSVDEHVGEFPSFLAYLWAIEMEHRVGTHMEFSNVVWGETSPWDAVKDLRPPSFWFRWLLRVEKEVDARTSDDSQVRALVRWFSEVEFSPVQSAHV